MRVQNRRRRAMKKEYLNPEMIIVELKGEDVITASGGFGSDTELPEDEF